MLGCLRILFFSLYFFVFVIVSMYQMVVNNKTTQGVSWIIFLTKSFATNSAVDATFHTCSLKTFTFLLFNDATGPGSDVPGTILMVVALVLTVPTVVLTVLALTVLKLTVPAAHIHQRMKTLLQMFWVCSKLKVTMRYIFWPQLKTFAGCLQSCPCIEKLTLKIICDCGTTCIDYVVRFLVLLASSLLQQRIWGKVVCERNAKIAEAAFSSATSEDKHKMWK